MNDARKTRDELVAEVGELRREVERLKMSERRLREAEAHLRNREERFGDLFEYVNDLIQCVDPQGRLAYANRAWKKTLGYSDDEIKGLTIFEIIDPACREHCIEIFGRLMAGEKVERVEVTFLARDGRKVDLEGSVNVRFVGGIPQSTRGIFRDITERRKLEEELRSLLLRDELTGLHNRRGFLALAEQQRKTANRLNKGLVLIYCDLDDMKKINDTLGHREGDRALGDAAKLLKMSVRESDVVARIGGDEFAILAMDVDDVDAQEIIARLQDNIHHFNKTAGRPFGISLSTGVSVFDDDRYRCIDEMLAHADGVMYQEKKRKHRMRPRGVSHRSGIHREG